MTTAGNYDIFVASYDPGGKARWARRFGGKLMDKGLGVAVNATGSEVYVTGEFQGVVDFGLGNEKSAGGTDVFLLGMDGAGNLTWVNTYGGTDADRGADLAVSAGGNVVLVGEYRQTVDVGGAALPNSGNFDIFVAWYSPLDR
jgi:hypothetical protein